MSNIERRYAYYDTGVLPEEGEYGVTYLTLYSSNAGNVYDGWVWDPDGKIPESLIERTYGYRNPDYPDYCWDDEVVVDLSNAQNRQESSEFAQGRITSFNTNVSSRPIILQDIDITGLTEEEREERATTVLFCAIPLVQDAYIQAQVEVQCKCNLSPDNTSGEMRVEAFYILNDESDRTMRPNPVHTFSVTSDNERHTLPWLYWNPALRHEDHNYIGVKLIATGGTVEIGISDDPDYGDAMITLASAGLTGDHIDGGKPVRIWIEGEQLVPLGYKLKIEDYDVFCEYDTGEIYVVTHFCTFNPEPGTRIEENFTLQAWYMGLHAVLRVQVALVKYIELAGPEDFHGSYELNIRDFTVLGYLETGDIWDVTDQCIYSPEMGTTIYNTTTLTATFVNPGPLPVSDDLTLTKHSALRTYTPYEGLIYTLYDDNYIIISGSVAVDRTETLWENFDGREGIQVPNSVLPVPGGNVGQNKVAVEWNATGKPSCILMGVTGNGSDPELYKGIGVTRLVNFAALDGSEISYVDFNAQPYIIGSNLRSINLSSNKLVESPITVGHCPLRITNMSGLDALDILSWDLSKIKYFSGFIGGSSNLKIVRMRDLHSVISAAYMFSGSHDLETVVIDGITFNPTEHPELSGESYHPSLNEAFRECYKLKNISITNANYTALSHREYAVSGIFWDCYEVGDDALKVFGEICSSAPIVYMQYCFRNCQKIENLEYIKDIDLSETLSWQQIFEGCISLKDLRPIANLDVSHIFIFSRAFFGCDSLRVISPISQWDVFKSRRHNVYGDVVAINLSEMFARSKDAYDTNDDFRSTHILDADQLNWEGYKEYAQWRWDVYVRGGTGAFRIITNAYTQSISYSKDHDYPEWARQVFWDEGRASSGNYPDGVFGGTDWRRPDSTLPAYSTGFRDHTETNVAYNLPEWYIHFINWEANRSRSADTRDAHWNGDRDISL